MAGSQIVLPNEGDVMKFENINYKYRHPFSIIADFESSNKATDDDNKRVHKPNSYGFYIISDIDAFPSKYYSYVGEDAAYQFIK